MKTIKIVIVLFFIAPSCIYAQENCLTDVSLRKIDLAWEEAQKKSDVDYMDNLLAKDFLWVHNNAKTVDDKNAAINRAKRYLKNKKQYSYARTTENISTIIHGKTGIVSGFTIVQKSVDTKPVTYHFMRTYSKKDGKCTLVGNHTMAIDKSKW